MCQKSATACSMLLADLAITPVRQPKPTRWIRPDRLKPAFSRTQTLSGGFAIAPLGLALSGRAHTDWGQCCWVIAAPIKAKKALALCDPSMTSTWWVMKSSGGINPSATSRNAW